MVHTNKDYRGSCLSVIYWCRMDLYMVYNIWEFQMHSVKYSRSKVWSSFISLHKHSMNHIMYLHVIWHSNTNEQCSINNQR